MLTRREAKKMVQFLKRDKAALVIQLSFQRYLKRKVHWLRRYHYHRNLACIELQRCVRGYWGRQKASVLKEWWANLKNNEHYAVMLQAKARGHHVRTHDKLVAPALIVLHEEWEQARKSLAATKLQAAVRRMLAKFRVRGWREVVIQRTSDVDIAINVLQRTIRAYNARCELARLIHYAEVMRKLRDRAAIRIQNLYRIAEGKYGGLMRGEEMARMKRIRNRACLHVQRVFRGFIGRESKRAAMYEHKHDMSSALLIQRVFRSTRILHWKDIKMNKVAAFVYKRQQLELQERQRCADIRNLQRLEGAQKDSASEEEVRCRQILIGTNNKYHKYHKIINNIITPQLAPTLTHLQRRPTSMLTTSGRKCGTTRCRSLTGTTPRCKPIRTRNLSSTRSRGA
jgi:hypothetical protein